MKTEKHNVTVMFDDGDTITTDINGTCEEITHYYFNGTFTRGYDDGSDWREYKQKVTSVKFNS